MAKVLFINPVVREEDRPRHVPYGIALLAAIIDKQGHQVQIYDANAWRASDEVLRDVVQADHWDVVAIGGITTAYGSIKKIVEFARELSPGALIVAGGGFLTSMPREIMHFLPQLDVGVVGEAFETFSEVLRHVDQQDRDFSEVQGVIYRDSAGKSRMTPGRPLLEDLDTLPYPAWEMFPLDIYFRNSTALYSEEGMQAKRRLDINASYGCSLICRFCFHLGTTGDMEYVEGEEGDLDLDVSFTTKRHIRFHSPEYIVNLVKYAKERFNVDFIGFLDENLMTMNAYTRWTWVPEICDRWIAAGLQPQCIKDGVPHNSKTCQGVHWSGTSHATLYNAKVLHKMRESGCSHLIYGLESFSNRILKNLGKGTTAKGNVQAVIDTLAAGIRPIPNQIIGFPDDFFDSFRDSLAAWNELGIMVYPFFATPYPGSEWYYRYKHRILEQYDGDLEAFLLDLGDATKITAVISENFNAVELLGIRELMVNRDLKHINEYEKLWRERHGEPIIPNFVEEAKVQRALAKGIAN
jgi:anaerobic magnesium-protoporphyrin IX monomethyl ester cyclase